MINPFYIAHLHLIHIWLVIVYFCFFVCIWLLVHNCLFFVCFVCLFLYLLAASVFYRWLALLTFGFSGNLALLLVVFWIAVIVVFLSQKYLLLLLLLLFLLLKGYTQIVDQGPSLQMRRLGRLWHHDYDVVESRDAIDDVTNWRAVGTFL